MATKVLDITKAELRKDALAHRNAISLDARDAFADAAAKRAMSKLDGARIVAVYNALASEMNPGPLVGLLHQAGVHCVFPRVVGPDTSLEFCSIASESELSLGPLGVAEPLPTLPAIDIGSIDAFVVPALSFDTAGNRLGWGKGYYDRTLAQNSDALRIGFCFHQQIHASIPFTQHDQSMDWVISELETIRGRNRERLTRPENQQ
ncbi:MAG: 5-formyltetrahydrofolate cyclo-ligase [Kofleriaceae bacterium]|nr:5-formyltetrahydrofolate cyclo-ligase [Kofleriaceae bacterium]